MNDQARAVTPPADAQEAPPPRPRLGPMPAQRAATSLRTARLYTSELPADERRAAYLNAIGGVLDTSFVDPDFFAEWDSFHVGPFHVILLEASARRNERTAARIAIDRHDAVGVQMVITGRARGRARGKPVVSDPGSIMILDYSQPFEVTDEGTRVVVNVAVPRALFPTQDGDVGKLHGTVMRGGASDLLSAYLRSLRPVLPKLPAASGDAVARVFADLLAIARDCARPDDPDGPATSDAQAIVRAKRVVDFRIGSADLCPAWLAARLNMSRSELYALMEPHGGAARFIMARRLEAAHAALTDPGDKRRIGEIAYAVGFSSEAHFARSFRAAFGQTATEIRRTTLNR